MATSIHPRVKTVYIVHTIRMNLSALKNPKFLPKSSNRWRPFSTRDWFWTSRRRGFSRGPLARCQRRAWARRRRLTWGWLAQSCAPWYFGPSGRLFLSGPEKVLRLLQGFYSQLLRGFTCWCFAFAMSSLIFFSFTWCGEMIVFLYSNKYP